MTRTSTAAARRHLVTVWNPAYGGIEEHVGPLLELAALHRKKELEDEDDVYVWWGKLRSPNRQQPMPHLADVLAIDRELREAEGEAPEVHLYVTDYRSLYVGHVLEVTADDVREDEEDAHVPAMYRRPGVTCDCWFRLMDIHRLVVDDTLSVVEELRKLRNTRYHDRPVSIYGGMVDLPLIVTRDDGQRWFEPRVRAQYTDERHWVEYDAEHSGVGAMERELRENLFGADAWSRLDPTARTFVATAEKVFRDHRADALFDFTPVVVGLAKAMEVQVNAVLHRALADAPRQARLANVDGSTIDVAEDGPLSVGQLARAIGGEQTLNRQLKRALRDGEWFTASLPAVLVDLADVRNPAAHTERVPRDRATELRDRMVGVGCEGVLVRLAGVRPV